LRLPWRLCRQGNRKEKHQEGLYPSLSTPTSPMVGVRGRPGAFWAPSPAPPPLGSF